MMSRMSMWRRMILVGCVGVACLLLMSGVAAAHSHASWMKAEDGDPMWVAEGKALIKAFQRGTSPLLHGATFRRLGVRWDGPEHIYLMARYSNDAKRWTSWLPLQRPWSEGTIHNSHGDPPGGTAKYAQLKVVGEGHPTFMAAVLITTLGPYKYKPAVQTVPPSQGKASSQAFGLTGPFNARSAWGAKAAKCTTSNRTKNRVAIHHTVTPTNDTVTPEARLRGIQNFHQNTRGWCDIGYHLLISQDGRAWEGTPAEFLGTHVGGNNTNTLGISFMGTYTSDQPGSKMLCTGAKLIDWAVKTFGVQRSRSVVLGHRQFSGASTSCPGDKLFAQISYMVTQSSSSNCQAPPPPKCDYVKISTATLNIRDDANTNNAPIGTVTQGTCLKVLAKKSGQSVNGDTTWYQISHNGKTGWVSGYYAPCSNCGPPADTKAPTVTITSPSDGQRFQQAPITIKGNAKDDVGVTKVEINGKAAKLNPDGTFELALTVAPGTHKVTATAFDQAGNKGTATISVILEAASEAPTETPAEPPASEDPPADAGGEPTSDSPAPTDTPATDDPAPLDQASPQDNASPDPGQGQDSSTPDTGTPGNDGRLVLDSGVGKACSSDSDCGTGLTCVNQSCTLPTNGYAPGGGCACHSQSSTPAFWGLLLLLLFAVARRRRRS